MMTVAFVHTDFRLYWKSRLDALGSFLKHKGDRLVVVEISGKGSPYAFAGDSSSPPGTEWRILFPADPIETISPTRAHSAVIRELDSISPDVVIAGAIAFPSGAASVAWSTRNHKPIVIFDDARIVDTPRVFMVDAVKRLLYKHVDAILCPAPSHLPTYIHFGFKPEQVFYGINAVDNDFFMQRVPSEKASLPKNDPTAWRYLLAVGRQVPKKNLGRLVSTFVTYKKLHPDSKLKLILIGEGPEHQSLFNKASETDTAGIIFYPFMNIDSLTRYYAIADALIMPSLYGETWGLVVNEAMASGLPVLVSNQCGCSRTLVREGINGWTFDPLNPVDIYRVIRQLDETDHSERTHMGEASLEIIRGWGIDRFCNGTYEALNFVRSKKKRTSALTFNILPSLWKGRYRPT